MALHTVLEKTFKNPAGVDQPGLVESMFADEMFPTLTKMSGVIMGFEALMIVIALVTGRATQSLRSQCYFALYVVLFLLTASFVVLLLYLRRHKPQQVKLQIHLALGYSVLLCAWSCALTLLDQYSGTNLNVYSYILMAMSVFCMLRPWQSVVLFGSGFVLLNAMAALLQGNPLFFQAPPDTFNLLINSFFMTTLAVIISITLYRYRVTKRIDRAVIQAQYDQIRAINQQLNDLAMTDQLTGLGNRRFLEEQMQQLAQGASTTCQTVTGMMLDIDFFKQYNDHYGHQAGDVCLQQLADILRDFAREQDAFAVRYGGEEFFLCLPGDKADQAQALLERVSARALARDDLPCGHITVSIGVDVEACWQTLGQDGFLRRCDQALYEAKNAGRNRVCLYTPE